MKIKTKLAARSYNLRECQTSAIRNGCGVTRFYWDNDSEQTILSSARDNMKTSASYMQYVSKLFHWYHT